MWPSSYREAWQWAHRTPWKAINEIRRLISWPWIQFYFARHRIAVGHGWRIYGAPVIQRHRESQISFGDRLELRNWRASSPLGVWHRTVFATWSAGAVIEIGADFGMTGGAICAAKSISIGQWVTIGANCTLIDTDFHLLEVDRRMNAPAADSAAPVIIEDRVFLGTRVIVLKGVHIGHGAVIGAGSVVTGNIPANMIAAGNPARVIGEVGR